MRVESFRDGDGTMVPPRLRPDLVPRPRLAQRLDEGRERGLVLACAPAGYGKTVLLAEWVRPGRGSASGWARCSGLPATVVRA